MHVILISPTLGTLSARTVAAVLKSGHRPFSRLIKAGCFFFLGKPFPSIEKNYLHIVSNYLSPRSYDVRNNWVFLTLPIVGYSKEHDVYENGRFRLQVMRWETFTLLRPLERANPNRWYSDRGLALSNGRSRVDVSHPPSPKGGKYRMTDKVQTPSKSPSSHNFIQSERPSEETL
jgi:hypothetical protein